MGNILKASLVVSAMALTFLAGCTMGYDRGAAESRLGKVVIDDVSSKPNTIKTPLKVALFADMETMISPEEFVETWDWSAGDKKLIVSYLENLEELGYISDYFIVPDNPGFSMQDINYMINEARKKDADVLISLRGIIKVNRYFNPAAILDLTILGACLFPGSNCDALLLVNMDMWNVKGKDCILTVNGEGIKRISEPTFLLEPEDAVISVRRDTLRKVLSEFKKRCREIKPAK
ncbi:MAG: hypothetical protein WCS96_06005 [Victivallales bacterium]|jgi:hypothetical protein